MGKKLTEAEKMVNAANRKVLADCKTAIVDANAEHFAGSIVQQLDVLSVRREQWEATDYKKANDGLYALLADCLDVFQARFVKGTDKEQKALRASLIQRL